MKYLAEILWYMVYPATIVVSYYAIKWAVKKLDVQDSPQTEE